ncbi:unnamed protein product [Lactuca virosa]|uniref:Uncharacterized protein n=1 Tax=Lactuca virosa TaxID=75947 RepID=A0AAU9P1W0_9ASTR|nr:unnamed protein product [Lactuca virosa]
MEFASAQSAFFLTAGAHRILHLKSVAVKLRTNERGLQQHKEALNIRVESLERELLDKETLQLDREAELSRLGSDLDWLDVGRIKNMCFTAGEESSREALRKAVVAGTFDPSAANSTSSYSGELVDAIDSFISFDYASMIKLGSLHIDGLS